MFKLDFPTILDRAMHIWYAKLIHDWLMFIDALWFSSEPQTFSINRRVLIPKKDFANLAYSENISINLEKTIYI